MTIRRYGSIAGLVILVSVLSLDGASARHRHRVRLVDRTPRHFVFDSPAAADTVTFAGKFGGYFQSGILGATTADPYEHPGYGYYAGGGRGPGYFYDR